MSPNKKNKQILILIIVLGLVLNACSSLNNSPQPPTQTPVPISIPTPEVSPTPSLVTKVTIYFIAGGDNGKSGKLIGCNDSVIPVEWEISPTDKPIKAALELLFTFKDQNVGPPHFYNALYQSNLAVDEINIDPSGKATVKLSGEYLLGGVCDNPRFQAQIEETVLNFPEVQAVEVLINDVLLTDILSGK